MKYIDKNTKEIYNRKTGTVSVFYFFCILGYAPVNKKPQAISLRVNKERMFQV